MIHAPITVPPDSAYADYEIYLELLDRAEQQREFDEYMADRDEVDYEN